MKKFLSILLAALCALLPILALAQDSTTITTTVPDAHAITIVCGEHGAAVVDGQAHTGTFTVEVKRQGTLVITVQPDSGYALSQVLAADLDGVAIADGNVTITGVHCDNTITLTFVKEAAKPTTTPTATATATAKPTATATATATTKPTATATAKPTATATVTATAKPTATATATTKPTATATAKPTATAAATATAKPTATATATAATKPTATATATPTEATTPTSTPAPDLEDDVTLPELPETGNALYDQMLGTGDGLGQLRIVVDGDYLPRDYELLHVQSARNIVLVRSYPDADGAYTQRSLMLSAAQLVKLAQQEVEQFVFANGEAAATFDLADLTGGAVQKLIGLIVKGNETVTANTLDREWAAVEAVPLTAAELAAFTVEVRILPVAQEDGSNAYDISAWLRWDDQVLDISALLPSLCVSLNAADEPCVVGYQAENAEGSLALASEVMLFPEDSLDDQPGAVEKFIVAIPSDGDPLITYVADLSLAQEQRRVATARYAGKGCYQLVHISE